MMKIESLSTQQLDRLRRGKRGGAGGDTGFAEALEGGDSGAAPVTGATNLGQVDALLALQEVSDDASGRAQQRGEALLDRLDELRLAILAGRLRPDDLERLTRLVAEQRTAVDDPRLAGILDEIELRAAVELAKLGY